MYKRPTNYKPIIDSKNALFDNSYLNSTKVKVETKLKTKSKIKKTKQKKCKFLLQLFPLLLPLFNTVNDYSSIHTNILIPNLFCFFFFFFFCSSVSVS